MFTILWLLVNLYAIMWVWADADDIGAPGILWAILCFFFGWLALLVYSIIYGRLRQAAMVIVICLCLQLLFGGLRGCARIL